MAAPPRGRRRTAAAQHGLHGLEEKLETTAPHPSQEEEEGNSSQTFFFLLSVKVLLLGGQSWSCSAASGQNFASISFRCNQRRQPTPRPMVPQLWPWRRTRYVVQALSQEVFDCRVSDFSLVQSNYNSDMQCNGLKYNLNSVHFTSLDFCETIIPKLHIFW